MTTARAGSPALAEVQAQYPGWDCSRGISGMYHAHNQDTGQRVLAEDLVDLNATGEYLVAAAGTAHNPTDGDHCRNDH